VPASLSVEWIPIERVFLSPSNPRINDPAVEHVAASIRRFDWQQPIVAKRSGEVIAGNTRLKAARVLGHVQVPVVWFDGTDLEAAAYQVADNRTHEFAEWDDKALVAILEHLRAEDALEGVGYSTGEIDDLLARLEAQLGPVSGEDQGPGPLPEDPVTRPGDLWVLGNHRLLCGDSSKPEDVDRLLAGAPVHLLNTDPPYNVRVEPRSNNAIAAGLSSFAGTTHHQGLDLARHPGKSRPTSKLRPKDRPLQNDFLPEAEFAELLRTWFGNAARVLIPGRSFYVWGGYSNFGNYPPALAESGLYFSQAIIWDKQHPVLTRKDFMGAFEVCYYGWREGAAHQFFGPNNVTDLWAVKKVNPQSMIHLTEKAVELASRAILYSSRPGENVLDLFGGSGSTLIAAEQAKRRAFLMEIDAPYCDVIAERWQVATGQTATLEPDGKSFEAIRAERGAA
jgi:DNA modification methylase